MDNKKTLPERKPTRLKYFDYSLNGAYFVTICTQGRKNILSAIGAVGEGSPLPKLSRYGEIVDNWIQELPKRYKEISVDCYVIMPNHIHLLLSLTRDDGRGDPSPTVAEMIGWLKYQATKDINLLLGTKGERVFQRSFYDHIVRNYDDYCETYKYIYENPIKWHLDKLYLEE